MSDSYIMFVDELDVDVISQPVLVFCRFVAASLV